MMTIAVRKRVGQFFRACIDRQIWLSRKFDTLLDESYRLDGNAHFRACIVPRFIRAGQIIYDIGGGSRPFIGLAEKKQKCLTVVGTDISQEELGAAPAGAYDRTVCADLTQYAGNGEADLVICQAVMEHVRDSEGAFRGISSTLKPGGHALLFMPSRNAFFARLNLFLPESWKKKILFSLFPHKAEGHDGFPAFYDKCTPRQFRALADKYGMDVEELHSYYVSSYFTVCAPFYVLWRAWIVLFRLLRKEDAAETFALVLKKWPAAA